MSINALKAQRAIKVLKDRLEDACAKRAHWDGLDDRKFEEFDTYISELNQILTELMRIK